MSETNLPASSNSPRAAAHDQELADQLAEMRKEVARAQTRIVHHVCAVTGGRFRARFGRDAPEGRFRIAAIEKEPPEKPARLLGGLFGRSPAPPQVFAAREFDWRGWYCPHCETKGVPVYCEECGQDVCKGRTRILPGGEPLFVCHAACGATGGLVKAETVKGASGESLPKPARALELGAPSSRPALPRPVGKLPGPTK